jgi:CheY-like chemotaxis protein
MRQPLQALGLYVNALKRRVGTDEARDIVGKIERAAGSLSGMFTALFDIARLQGEHTDVEMETFPLEPAIARIAGEFDEGVFTLPEGATSVTSDRSLLERLMRNLMSNAVRHGGGKAQIRVARTNGRAVVTVADDGPGIAAEDQERIFEEFQRLDERTKAESLGLGLSIVRRIAQLIGAEVTLESAPGEGARFSVSLPLATSVAHVEAVAPRDAALVGLRVATMDDDPLVLEAMAQMLRDAGAEVRAAANENGLRGLFTDGWKPHAIVTDFRIDGVLCGADAARAASASLSPSPGILVVTGDTAPETMETLRGLGVAWMVKPVAPDALTRAVRELIASET